jgi:hypothetical protein
MAKATVDGTVPCQKCGNVITVETQRFTGGPDQEREVFIKCLRCQSETLYGVYKKYGNTLVEVERPRSTSHDSYNEQVHIDSIFQGRWIGLRFISGVQGRPGYKETPIDNRIFCTASATSLELADGRQLEVEKVTVGRFFDASGHQNLINFTTGEYFLVIKLEGDRIGVCLEFGENANPIKRFEGRIAPARQS